MLQYHKVCVQITWAMCQTTFQLFLSLSFSVTLSLFTPYRHSICLSSIQAAFTHTLPMRQLQIQVSKRKQRGTDNICLCGVRVSGGVASSCFKVRRNKYSHKYCLLKPSVVMHSNQVCHCQWQTCVVKFRSANLF